ELLLVPHVLEQGDIGAHDGAVSRSIARAPSTRGETPSLMKMLRIWDSMVLSLRNSSAAISRLVMRSVTRSAISRSRFVSAPTPELSAAAGPRGSARAPSLR